MSWTSFVRAAASAETNRVRAQVRQAVRHTVRSLVLVIIAVVLLAVAIVFALTGAYASLSQVMPGWQAGGLIALVALALCLLLLSLARREGNRVSGQRPPPPGPRAPRPEDLQATAELGAAAGSAASEFVRRHRPSVTDLILAAFVVGLVASRQSRKRDR